MIQSGEMKRPTPFFELTQIQSRLNQIFDALSEAREAYATSTSAEGRLLPETDVFETPEALVAIFELPGVKPSSVRLRIERGMLVLEGEKARSKPSASARRFHCVERGYGKFRRAVLIASPVNGRAATAELRNGLLTVTLPKVEERRGQVVEIAVKD